MVHENGAAGGTGVRYLEVAADEAGLRLDKFLGEHLPGVPRTRVFRIIRRGEVRLNGGRVGPQARLAAGDRVRVPPVRIDSGPVSAGAPTRLIETVRQAIIQEDARVLVLDKPAGLAVHGGSGVHFGVIEALRALRPEESLELVHRLDRDTSGCLLVARTRAALREAHALLREGRSEKRYLTLLAGRWNLGHKRIDVPLATEARVSGERTVRADPRGKPSVSDFRLLQTFGGRARTALKASLLEVILHTGRTHQIRVHAAYAGHPVAGDEKYGDAACNGALRELGLRRMFLHAHSISFQWPDGTPFSASAPLPAELSEVLERLERQGASRAPGSRRAAAHRPAK